MPYRFDEVIERAGTNCVKYDARANVFGSAEVIPMWVADMDFRTPPFVTAAIRKRAEHELFGYFLKSEGYYQSIIGWMQRRHGWKIEKDWIVFSPGIVPALNMCVLAYTQPGDKVIVQPPVYFPFFSAISNHGRQLVYNPLEFIAGGYRIDFEHLESVIDSSTKMLIISSPHNPVGRVWTAEELRQLGKICLRHNILILSDEIHLDLVYRGSRHMPTASLGEDIAQITVTCIAPSKTFNLAGLSTSSLIIPNVELRKKFSRVIDDLHVSNGNIFGAVASEAAYREGDQWVDELMVYLEGNLAYLESFISGQIPQIKVIKPQATYMVWLDFRSLGMEPQQLKDFLVFKAGIGLNEGSVFGPGGAGYMRMNIACPRSVLAGALEKLKNAVKARE